MSDQLEKFTVPELKALAKKIEKQKEPFKRCKDGSYECALDSAGYYDIQKELERRKQL